MTYLKHNKALIRSPSLIDITNGDFSSLTNYGGPYMEKQKLHNTDRQLEKAILVAVENDRSVLSAEESLNELEDLTKTAGAEVLDRLIQRRDVVHAGHYLGKGKLEELKDLAALHGANMIICDDELSPAQIRNMSKQLDLKIIDRTLLILDIFAKRAVSSEGKVQVELAQLKYTLSHLSGLGISLSRLGGGIGTRGPGESKLESDRRHIRSRISELQHQLEEIQTQRGVQREQRTRNNVPVVSLAGYTNAGKSTLMNLLTNAGVLEEDKLFATLDTTTRKVKLPGGTGILLTDTVGFIHKLPHNLVKAFRATLEETVFADIILHVIDSANPMREHQMSVVYKTLKDLDCIAKPIIAVFNKSDKNPELPFPSDANARAAVSVSAKTGDGVQSLLDEIEKLINSLRQKTKICLPYSEGSLLDLIHRRCEIVNEEHTEEGTLIELYANDEIAGKILKYIL